MTYNKLLFSFNEYCKLVSSIILKSYPQILKDLSSEIKKADYYAFSLDLLIAIQFISVLIVNKKLKLSAKNAKFFLNELNASVVSQVISSDEKVLSTYNQLFETKVNMYFEIFKRISDQHSSENEIILGFSRIVLSEYIKEELEAVATKKMVLGILEVVSNLKRLLSNTRNGQKIFGKPNFIVIKSC